VDKIGAVLSHCAVPGGAGGAKLDISMTVARVCVSPVSCIAAAGANLAVHAAGIGMDIDFHHDWAAQRTYCGAASADRKHA